MKIALVSFHFAEYTFLLADALAEQNEVLLILNQENVAQELGSKLSNYSKQGLNVVILPERGLKNPLMLCNLYHVFSEIKQFNPDVIHCQETIKDYLIGALVLLRKFPLVLTIHDHILHTGKDSKERKRILFYRNYLRHIPDAVIVHGELIRQESEQIMPWLTGKVHTVPHGVLGNSLSNNAFDWEPGVLLFFGRIEQYKGLKYFIETVQMLASEGVKVKGLIAGSGDDLEKHRKVIESDEHLELIDRYIKDEEVPVLFNRANVVVLPYTDATQSGVAAMAMGFGRPVVSTKVGSIDEVVRDGYNGFVVPPEDSGSLAREIKKILEDQELALNMAKNAIKLSNAELSWQAIAIKTIDVYNQAITIKNNIQDKKGSAGE